MSSDQDLNDHLVKINAVPNQDDSEQIYQKSKFKVLILSFSFMLLFSAFNSAQNLVGSLYKGNLGLISVLFLYAIFAVSCLFAKKVINRLSYKITFILSSLGYNFFAASGIWVCLCDGSSAGVCSDGVIYFIVLLGAGLCGMGASTIWIAQGSYIDTLCLKCPEKRGNLFGMFWSINQSSLVAGAILGCFILKYLGNLYYFIVMTALGLAATLFFFLLPDVSHNAEQLKPIGEQIKDVFKLMTSVKVRPFIPFMVLAGIIVGFYSGFLKNLVNNSIHPVDDNDKSQKLAYVLISLGVFEIISGLISGKLADKYCVYKLATLGTLICQGALLLCFVGIFTQSYFVCFIIASFWGFCDCYFQNMVSIIASRDYQGQMEIFQVFRIVLSFSVVAFQIINILLQDQQPYILCMIIMVLQMIANFATSFFTNNTESKATVSAKSNED